MNDVALVEQQPCQISAIPPGNSRDKRDTFSDMLPPVCCSSIAPAVCEGQLTCMESDAIISSVAVYPVDKHQDGWTTGKFSRNKTRVFWSPQLYLTTEAALVQEKILTQTAT